MMDWLKRTKPHVISNQVAETARDRTLAEFHLSERFTIEEETVISVVSILTAARSIQNLPKQVEKIKAQIERNSRDFKHPEEKESWLQTVDILADRYEAHVRQLLGLPAKMSSASASESFSVSIHNSTTSR